MKTLLCTLLLTAFTLTAADLAGKWSGSFDITTAEGEYKPDTAVIHFKLDGASVTGTAGPNEDKQWSISKGKLEGTRLTFEVAVPADGDDSGGTLVFDLVFDGETIRGTANGSGGNGEKMTAKLDLKRAG